MKVWLPMPKNGRHILQWATAYLTDVPEALLYDSGNLRCFRILEAPNLCGFLPRDFIGAGPDYLAVQCMGHAIEIPIEIFIDWHLFDISTHCCTVAATHPHVSLRRHISR